NVNSAVTIDANWRWVHDKDYRNCYDGKWGSQCQDPATCAAQCVLEGVEEADWKSTYGITFPDEKSVQLNLVTGTNIGSRLYLLDSTKNSYYGFNPMNREFHFTVDSSKLGCGLNGALYFVTMDLTSEDTTAAGPAYGVGYADAQCPADIKYINGIPNVSNPPLQICSPEMDLWEANKFSNAFTPHPCATPLKATVCNGLECGNGSDRQNGLCDKDGADYNPYRGGNTTFYGPSSTNVIDSTKPIKVITQFITKNNADDGDLVKIQRFYQQGGKTFYGGMMTDTFNDLQKDLFKDPNTFKRLGGMKQMGVSLRNKMVLVMSIWGDTVTNMEWLDSSVPAGSKEPGHVRGVCPPGKTYQDSIDPKASVTYSDIQLNKI
ncbi:glycoside hydrolase, partial [Globomyces pollinis-pini]